MPPRNGNKKGLSETNAVDDISQYRWLRPSMLVITTNIEGGPSELVNTDEVNESAAAAQREKISQLMNSIWQLDNSNNIRWLFITDDSVDLEADDSMRTLLWQLFCRFEVKRDLHFSDDGGRICWDATAPIPSIEGPCSSKVACCLFTRPRCSERSTCGTNRRCARGPEGNSGICQNRTYINSLPFVFIGAELVGDLACSTRLDSRCSNWVGLAMALNRIIIVKTMPRTKDIGTPASGTMRLSTAWSRLDCFY